MNKTKPAMPGAVRNIAFDVDGRGYAFSVKPPGNPSIPSVFFVGLPKAGSTLLNRLMKPITISAGLTFVAPQEIMFDMGVAAHHIPPEISAVFQPFGYAFGGFRSLPRALALPIYAADRTVVLVRDPRDMLTSLYFSLARSHRPPGQRVGGALAATFQETRDEVNRTDIDVFALENANLIVSQYNTVERKLSGTPHKLYRYEDIIFDKLSWAKDMAGYLGLSVEPEFVERVVANNDVRPDIEDVSQHIRRVVPGDHAEKLRADTIAELDKRFEPILRRYRYV